MEFDGHILLGLVNYKPLFGILRSESFLPLLWSITLLKFTQSSVIENQSIPSAGTPPELRH